VKLGLHSPTGEKVAIKILEKNKIKDSADIERVAREIKIMKKLKHSNIAQLYEVIETDNQICIVLEYVSGGELFDYIVSKGKLKESAASQFYYQILNATEYIHQNNIVHRDLKPENLLLGENNSIKLADFGLSNFYEPQKMLNTPCGSPCYAAPEMVAGKSYSGLSVDIWSSGIVLYAMVCGFLPFEDPNTANLYKKIIKGEYEEPPWLSTECKDLLKHILDTNPSTRYSINQIRNHTWMRNIVAAPCPKDSIDNKILQIMEGYNIDTTKVKNNLELNLRNSMTTLYYLLCKKNCNKLVPHPPTYFSYEKLQMIHGIRHIDVKKSFRPVSRIKIIANSVSPKAPNDNKAQSRSAAKVRRVMPPKEPETRPRMPTRKSHRTYKPIKQDIKMNFSYKSTPRDLETSYRMKYSPNLFSP
jgi:5'-AMP-activated protein kinase, catalytic alpha subunit